MRKDIPEHSPRYWSLVQYKAHYKFISTKSVIGRFKHELRMRAGHFFCRMFFNKHDEGKGGPDWTGITFYCKYCGTTYKTSWAQYGRWNKNLQAPVNSLL
jgi:hypothetical protein